LQTITLGSFIWLRRVPAGGKKAPLSINNFTTSLLLSLAAMWSDVLGSREKINVRDSYFESAGILYYTIIFTQIILTSSSLSNTLSVIPSLRSLLT